jgi:hexosaminidase
LFFQACNSGTPADPNVSIVPKPQSLTVKPGSFKIKNGTPVVYCSNDLQADAGYLAGSFKQLTGLELPVRTQESANAIILKLNEQIETPEGYTLKSDDQRVVIEAKTSDGIFLRNSVAAANCCLRR